LSTEARNTYEETVTPLRKSGILKQIRSNGDASQMAKQMGKLKKKIARFKVQKPK